jgi:hypothetical protein
MVPRASADTFKSLLPRVLNSMITPHFPNATHFKRYDAAVSRFALLVSGPGTSVITKASASLQIWKRSEIVIVTALGLS